MMRARVIHSAMALVCALAACRDDVPVMELAASPQSSGEPRSAGAAAGGGGGLTKPADTSGASLAGRASADAGAKAIGAVPAAASGEAGRPIAAGSAASAGQAAAAGGMAGQMGGTGSTVSAAGSGGSLSAQAAAGSGSPPAMSGAMPSAGCAKQTARPANGSVMRSDRIYSFPGNYDGKTPLPLLLALHAAGNPNTQLQKLTQGSRLETDFVRAFPKSKGNAWVYNTDVALLNEVLDELLASYCIDQNRIFATGHSSGAQMVVQMLCKGEKRFRGVAPVAASKYCAELAAVPVLYIQGMMDAQRGGGNGEDVVRVFETGNGCKESSAPVASIQSCTSSFDRMSVAPGCVSFDSCKAPTLWCSHNDNGYNNSDGRQHGWPCFASAAIAEFFLGL